MKECSCVRQIVFSHRAIICNLQNPQHIIMSVLDFFPVHEKQNLGKIPKDEFKSCVFGFDGMQNLPNKELNVPNDFPWALKSDDVTEIVGQYIHKPFVSILEVGSHIGTSAAVFANTIKNNPDSYVVCVDTWLSDVADYILRKDGVKHNLTHGYNHTLFDRFIQNIQNNGLENTVIPFRLPSIQAGQILYFYGIQFDIIYIDAAHEYLNVKMDLDLYWNLIANDGFFFGNDYNIDGVKRAVDEFVKTRGLTLYTIPTTLLDNCQQKMWIINR